MSNKTVTINGKVYDMLTGMPIEDAKPSAPSHTPHPSSTIHQNAQKSQTLNRRTVKKTGQAISARKQPQLRGDIVRHASVAKFAPHPTGAKPAQSMDVGPTPHPAVTKAHQHIAAKKAVEGAPKPAPKPSQVIKQEAVQESLEKAPSHSANHKEIKHKKRAPRIISLLSASLALLLLGGYFTYLNMPSLSVRVAAAQAGVNATYPSYHPDGYSLNGPVAYTDGKVSMKFASNSGPQNFTVDQTKSDWDSSAVLDNYVKQKAGDNYLTYDANGLTIYTFGGDAAWVNGGVLYTISGDAPLSGDQIRHLATSM